MPETLRVLIRPILQQSLLITPRCHGGSSSGQPRSHLIRPTWAAELARGWFQAVPAMAKGSTARRACGNCSPRTLHASHCAVRVRIFYTSRLDYSTSWTRMIFGHRADGLEPRIAQWRCWIIPAGLPVAVLGELRAAQAGTELYGQDQRAVLGHPRMGPVGRRSFVFRREAWGVTSSNQYTLTPF